MLDNLKIVASFDDFDLLQKDNSGFIYFGKLRLVPVIDKRHFHITKHQTVIENLLFTITENEIIITNSLHKFIKGNNYSDFTFSELLYAIELIEDITGVNANVFIIKKMEFAINIETPQPAYQYLERFSSFKGKEFDKMRIGAFWYGIKYFFTEYNLKIYDKSELTKRIDKEKIDKNILRFEIQYNRIRKIPIVNNLSELKDPEILKAIFKEFIETIENIKCSGDEDFSLITARERELYFAGSITRFWNVEKVLNRNTAKSKIAKYRDIQNRIVPKDLMNEFVKSITKKFNELIEG